MINLLDILKNNLKNAKRTKMIVSRIEINIRNFITRLSKNKLDKPSK